MSTLREWCANAGHVIVHEYVERVSGGKGKEGRPEFARMLDDAHRRQFAIVLVLGARSLFTRGHDTDNWLSAAARGGRRGLSPPAGNRSADHYSTKGEKPRSALRSAAVPAFSRRREYAVSVPVLCSVSRGK